MHKSREVIGKQKSNQGCFLFELSFDSAEIVVPACPCFFTDVPPERVRKLASKGCLSDLIGGVV
jgi:hypothetical protein